MKKIYLVALAIIGALFFGSSCNKNEESVSFYLTYYISTNSGEYMAETKTSNGEVFNEFYQKILSGDMVAPTYELTFTEKNTGAVYSVSGKWSSKDMITLRTGTYKVTGKSAAPGNSIQEKCSLVFNDDVVLDTNTSTISLNANYDCALIVFSDASIASLQNFNGESTSDFFRYSNYFYAFINDALYLPGHEAESYLLGKHSNDANFKVFTGNLGFDKGKYYIYNSIMAAFTIEPMEEGDNIGDATRIVLPPDDEIWYESHSGNTIPLAENSSLLVSNTYSNGKGIYKFSKALTEIGGMFDYSDQCETTKENEDFKSLILPKNITYVGQFGISHLCKATKLVLPYNLSSMGSDCLCGFGEWTQEISNIYFIGETAPSFVSTSIWNMHDKVLNGNKIDNFHYPENNNSYNSLLGITIQGSATHYWVPTKYIITFAN